MSFQKKSPQLWQLQLETFYFKWVQSTNNASLLEEQAICFHHTVAQLLFVSARTRHDIQTPVAFLTTRVKRPDEDDWGKLKRVLKYLNGTQLKLTIQPWKLDVVKWFVDASYAIHDDCKGHTWAMMTLGKGTLISFSRKQKLNAKSSTEAELIRIDDALPQILWTKFFSSTGISNKRNHHSSRQSKQYYS